ncbi:RNA methyltransferase [Rickettsiales endosymbiont of Stachyamoeba lipophora]|uniref:RNA methyltransferase n=1 Tax=Rickettsiales endosymbiont of Stachyamoeba lipophora TaxID=2486578 RepID=UPI0013DE4960|nr:RNA methyltransferase [Rickettsiales endosymbiont of Stachyamoeba lipophora]
MPNPKPNNNLAITFILCEPQMGENIGAAARVMANFGIENLRIINPRDGWPNLKAEEMATCGKYILENATIYNSLAEAINELEYVYALCGKNIFINKPTLYPNEAWANLHTILESNVTKVGFVFGCERIGLTHEQISLCNAILHIPTTKKCESMNLAQAIGVIAYELNKQFANTQKDKVAINKNIPATSEQVSFMLKQLEGFLDTANFFQEPHKKNKMVINIHNIFTKNLYSEQEIRTLHGIFRSLYEYGNIK